MPRKKTDKRITYLDPIFSEVLVCKNKNLRPQIEIMVQEPENVSQEGLGTILGIFEITDDSEDSSYIVNFLISVIKKEYFSKPKRGPIESLEAALNKANLALSKLAEHENINWIGKFNTVCAVFERGNFYFSKAGETTVLLLRSHTLTDISRNMTPADVANPLKTFIDIVSGRLEEEDKIIISTDEIFNIFSPEEIKRSALKFSPEEFMQFLQTALVNELDQAAVLVADVRQREVQEIPYTPPKTELNAFSQSAFERAPHPETVQREKETEELKKLLRQEDGGFIDKKTGHIYIKEDSCQYQEQSAVGGFFSSFHGKIIIAASFAKPSKIISILSSPFKKWRGKKNTDQEAEKEAAVSEPEMPQKEKRVFHFPKPNWKFIEKIGGGTLFLLKKIKNLFVFLIGSLAKTFAWLFSKIKLLWLRMNRQQKIYAIVGLAAIIIFPYIFLTSGKPAEIKTETAQEIAPPAPNYDELRGDAKNIANLSNIYSSAEGGILKTVIVKDRVLAVKNDAIIDIQSQEVFPLPDNFRNPKLIAGMDDLQLIFLLNNENKLTAFSPVSKKFQDNTLPVPDGADFKILGTYLTYLYAADGKNNQIYRYPRATGGFGDKADWLKDSANLENTSGIAISENLYVTNRKEIQKFFRGKKQDFSIKNPEGKTIIPDEIYTIGGNDNLFVLDKTNMLILKLDKNGNILSKYFSPEIKDASNFAINEQENKVFLGTENKVLIGSLE